MSVDTSNSNGGYQQYPREVGPLSCSDLVSHETVDRWCGCGQSDEDYEATADQLGHTNCCSREERQWYRRNRYACNTVIFACLAGFSVALGLALRKEDHSIPATSSPTPVPTLNETRANLLAHRTCPDNDTLQRYSSTEIPTQMADTSLLVKDVWTRVAINQGVCNQVGQNCSRTVEDFERFCKGSYNYI